MNTQTAEQSTNRIDLAKIQKKKINLVIFGKGNVGSKLIDQILASKEEISKRRDIELNIFAMADSKRLFLNQDGFDDSWKETEDRYVEKYTIDTVIDFSKKYNLVNLIAIDNTSSSDFVSNYPILVSNGFNLISSNKIGNTIGLDFYQNLRNLLVLNKKEYLYETNVGAGLPIIDTIKLLHLSGDNITRIKGVFSGSLSYIFNTFSEEDIPFSEVLKKAIRRNLTEPDPREDLSGNDVGRKLLILARELDLQNEFEEVSIENLIPKALRRVSADTFLEEIADLDVPFQIRKKNQQKDNVFRYVADLHGDLSKDNTAILDVKLISVQKNSVLGRLQDSDTIFEIYTESYGENPIVIQGAGAGAEVTARGVFGDILRLSDKIN
ncbi:MAG: homoserine dehydrogenase [Flavobacteriaceae bacterium]|jgi:aspartokinase/homoserine dehydrogenase 1